MRDAVRRFCGAAVAVAGVAVCTTAWAVDAAPASPAEREAQVRFEEGLARVKASNFEGARMSFTQAYAVLRKLPILWNLALAEEKSGHLVEAVQHFRLFARLTASPEDRAGAEKHIAALAGQVARLDVDAPAGAEIVVDGVPAGVAPWAEPLDVSPGHHRVEVRGEQGTREALADVIAGQVARVSLAASDPASAGEAAPAAAPAPPALARRDENRSGGEPDLAVRQEPSLPRVLTVVGIGTAAVASVALGVYFALQSQSEKSTSDAFRASYHEWGCYPMPTSMPCTQWNDVLRAQSRDATMSNGFYIGGGVLAAGAVATWFLWPEDRRRARAVVVTPSLGSTGAGLVAAGRF